MFDTSNTKFEVIRINQESLERLIKQWKMTLVTDLASLSLLQEQNLLVLLKFNLRDNFAFIQMS